MLTILIRLIYLTGFINSYAELLYLSQHQNDHDVFVDLEAALEIEHSLGITLVVS